MYLYTCVHLFVTTVPHQPTSRPPSYPALQLKPLHLNRPRGGCCSIWATAAASTTGAATHATPLAVHYSYK
jgi:hypothetical protein